MSVLSVPRFLEIGLRLLERFTRSVGWLPGNAARIETAGPGPLRLRNRDAVTQADVADADVAEIDEPALAVLTLVWPAGKFGCHAKKVPSFLTTGAGVAPESYRNRTAVPGGKIPLLRIRRGMRCRYSTGHVVPVPPAPDAGTIGIRFPKFAVMPPLAQHRERSDGAAGSAPRRSTLNKRPSS